MEHTQVRTEKVSVRTRYTATCFDQHGRLKWQESGENLVVTEGRNTLLDCCVKTIPSSVAWYVGLKGTGTVDPADVMNSHAGWSEITPYSNATRPAFTPGTIAAGAVSNSASKAVFNINATATVYGAMLSSNNTKGGTTGLLYGAGNFTTERGVASGDTLNVQVDLSITAS